jgi:hypothetical protein
VKEGTGVWLGWPDGGGAVAVVWAGTGVAGAVVAGPGDPVGLTVGAAVVAGRDGVAVCGSGVWGGAGDALWIGVLIGAGVSGYDDDGMPEVNPPPVLTGPEAGRVAKYPCS